MARITIPQRNRGGLSKLLALPPDAFDALLAGLVSQRPGLEFPVNAPEQIKLTGFTTSDVDDIITAAISLSIVRWSRDLDIDPFVADVAEAISSFDAAGQTDESRQRLRKIISIESLLITSKALTIFTDYQRTTHASKILTDLRYVFKDDPEEEPYGAVIVHLLKLTYHEDTEHKEFFIAMSDGDLQSLKEVIARAEKKAHNLRRKLDAAHTVYLGIIESEEEDHKREIS